MNLIEYHIDIRDNERAYITAYYKCMFEGCPIQKPYGNGLNVHKTIYGVKSNTKFEIKDERKKLKEVKKNGI